MTTFEVMYKSRLKPVGYSTEAVLHPKVLVNSANYFYCFVCHFGGAIIFVAVLKGGHEQIRKGFI